MAYETSYRVRAKTIDSSMIDSTIVESAQNYLVMLGSLAVMRSLLAKNRLACVSCGR